MIILSLNCRGLANNPKKLALKEVIQNYNPDMLLLQETLGAGEEVSKTLSKILLSWIIQVLDAKGHSGGLAMVFKQEKFKGLNSWGMDQVMGMEVYSQELCTSLLIVNIMDPAMEEPSSGRPSSLNTL